MNYKLPTTIVADVILLTSFDTIFTDISTVALRAFHGDYPHFHTLIMQRPIINATVSSLRSNTRRSTLGYSGWTSDCISLWKPEFEEVCMMFGFVNDRCEAIIKIAIEPTLRI
jgi:hypothetical protein